MQEPFAPRPLPASTLLRFHPTSAPAFAAADLPSSRAELSERAMSLCPVPPGASQNDFGASVLVSATMTRLTTGDLSVRSFEAYIRDFTLVGRAGRPRRVRPPPVRTGRADFPHPAPRVELPSVEGSLVTVTDSLAVTDEVSRMARWPVLDISGRLVCVPFHQRRGHTLLWVFATTFFPQSHFWRSFFTEGPSLHGHCPVSSLLRPSLTSALGFPYWQTSQVPVLNFRNAPCPYTPTRQACRVMVSARPCWLRRKRSAWPRASLLL